MPLPANQVLPLTACIFEAGYSMPAYFYEESFYDNTVNFVQDPCVYFILIVRSKASL